MKKNIIFFLVAAIIFITSCERSGDLIISDGDSDIIAEYTQTEQLSSVTAETPSDTESSQTETEPPQNTTITPRTIEPEIITTPPVSETQADTSSDVSFARPTESGIAFTAQSLLGIPFADGGSTPDEGFDNSGFIHYVLTQNGFLSTPRRVSEQAEMGDKIYNMNELRSGDLVFFSTGGGRAEYGGIYIGDGLMIYSPKPGEIVKEQNIGNDYWYNTFFVGVRVL